MSMGKGAESFCQDSRFPSNHSKQSSTAPDFETCSIFNPLGTEVILGPLRCFDMP